MKHKKETRMKREIVQNHPILTISKISIILFPFFPNVFSYSGGLYYAFILAKVSIFAYYGMRFIKDLFNGKGLDIFLWITIGYNAVLLIATIINGGNLIKYTGYLVSSLGITLVIKYLSQDKGWQLVCSMRNVCRFLIFVNLITIALFPHGLIYPEYHFLGNDNISVPSILMCATLVLYSSYIQYDRITFDGLLDFLLCAANLIIIWSGTGVTGLLVFLVVCVGLFYFKGILNIRKMIVISGVACYLILFASNISFLQNYIVGFLGKDMTFTGRTYIWKEAMTMIQKKPLLGYGILDSQAIVYSNIMGYYKWAHNEYLQSMLNGGIFYCMLIVFAIIMVAFKLKKYEQYRATYFLQASISAYMIMFITETYGNFLFLSIILAFSYYLPAIDSHSEIADTELCEKI